MKKTAAQAHIIIAYLVAHTHEWHQVKERKRLFRVASVESNDNIVALTARMETFGIQMEKMTKVIHVIQVGYETCRGRHLTKDCEVD